MYSASIGSDKRPGSTTPRNGSQRTCVSPFPPLNLIHTFHCGRWGTNPRKFGTYSGRRVSIMPVATGRFRPADGRFEYELTSETFWEEAEQDALKQLEARMEPHLTIPAARFRHQGIKPEGPVRFLGIVLRYCDVLPHRDAAHVFPPFGAQGIANGIRDSLALSWRLVLLCDENQHGAGKTAQIWFKMADGTILLSDHIFRESTSILTVLVLGSVTAQEASELKQVIDSGELPPNILAENVVILRDDKLPCNSVAAPWISELFPCRPMIWRRWASRYSEATIRRPSEDDFIPQRATYWCVQTSSFPPRRSQLKSWQDNWVR
ncbi:hypothetical protein FOXYS1_7136 [Fusarium oxysporum]|uniref:FAD-binding domain-containing protein n=1 Tax=Fusarium oxysporum TaxID=5507 RepID=A0A8H5AC83_FUSOX|nr:hypothetical protein FOXYS1_7136 [Fusarium oxysporum]